jgi:hypothetical protein
MAGEVALSVDQLSLLLRLYMDWPHHIDTNEDAEANEFYMWLASELDEAELQDITGGLGGVKSFIKSNPDVIPTARYLKNKGDARPRDVREEARIAINTQVFVLIYDCNKDPELEGRIVRGMMMDMARNGMRLETKLPIPPGTILSMTVAQTGSSITLYHLTGEVRWLSEGSDSNNIGISIFNIEDFRSWEDFYETSTTFWSEDS